MASDDQSENSSLADSGALGSDSPPAAPAPVSPAPGNGTGPSEQPLGLGERRQSRPVGADDLDAREDEALAQQGMTWRQVIGIIGMVAGVLLAAVYLFNPEHSWGVIQLPLIGVMMGMGAWLFCLRWPSRWIWVIGSTCIVASAWMLLGISPWLEALGMGALGFGCGSWCSWGYRDKRRSGWFTTFITLTAYMVFIAAAILQAKHGNPWWLLGFGLASCLVGGLFMRSTLAKPLKPPTWWRIRHFSGRLLLLTGIIAPYATLVFIRLL